jgi:hypothetical protein
MNQPTTVPGRCPRPRSRLHLALEPFLPNRPVEGQDLRVAYGYDLRLRGGPRLSGRDPLLRAFGVDIASLESGSSRLGDLQRDVFSPGRELSLIVDRDSDAGTGIGLWDAERVWCAGRIDSESAAVVLAAQSYGLVLQAVALDEVRSTQDGMRTSLRAVVYSERFASLRYKRVTRYMAPELRERILLIVNSDLEVLWWDSEAANGPASLEQLGASDKLRDAHEALERTVRKLRRKRAESGGRYTRYEPRRRAERLERQAEQLWLLARTELAGGHIVGYLGPSMTDPIWTPEDLVYDCEEWWEFSQPSH